MYFTDAGWNAEQHKFQRQINEAANPATTSPSGGAMRYTAPSGGLPAGTVVSIRVDSRIIGEPGAYNLTVSGADARDFSGANDEEIFGSQGVSISTFGDQLIIFTGTPEAPFFLFGLNTGANVWDRGSTSAQHASDVPAGLADSVTAVAIGTGPKSGNEVDNGRYTGPVEGTKAALLAAVVDRNNWETNDSPFDDITNGVTQFSLEYDPTPAPVPDTTAVIALDTVFVEPGEGAVLTVSIVNNSSFGIGEVRSKLQFGEAFHITINNFIINAGLIGFDVETAWSGEGDTLDIRISGSGEAAIPPGAHVLGTLGVTANGGPVPDILGSEAAVGLIDASLVVIDTFGQPIGVRGSGGVIQTGVRGDVSRNGRVDILDVIRCVRIIVGLGGHPLPEPGSVSFAIADGNTDGRLNVGDAIAIVNRILGLQTVMQRATVGEPVDVRLGTPITLQDSRPGIPVIVEASRPVAGAQMTFAYRTDHMTAGTPLLDTASRYIMEHAVRNRDLHVVLYSLDDDPYLPAEHTPLLVIPITLSPQIEEVDFLLTEVILVDRSARRIPIRIGNDRRSVKSGNYSHAPNIFTLLENVPNPFNPTTNIAYTVAEQAYMTLIVYDILGHEVVRLVDQGQNPGHYRVVWNGRNASGEDVSSGLYIYRLASDTGYAQTRRMMLVK